MKVCVIGLGYIGLPTAAMLALEKYKVVGIDINKKVIDAIYDGKVHFFEPELENILEHALKGGNLRCSIEPEQADVFLITVPTPNTKSRKADLSAIHDAILGIGPLLIEGNLIILESTSSVGTTENITSMLQQIRPELKFPVYGTEGSDVDVHIAYCPERVLPGRILEELITNDRIVGGVTATCALKAERFYSSFVKGNCVVTDSRTAELCKLSENAFRDVNIAFANELSTICDKHNIDVWELVRLANHHPRVDILQPGPGVGGHCIAVDPWFIIESAPAESILIKTAREINDNRPNVVFARIQDSVESLGRDVSDLVIACFGLSFKRDVDDFRGSPAVDVVEKVLKEGFKDVMLVEPHLKHILPGKQFSSARLVDSVEALQHADILVLLVDHEEFRTLDTRLRKAAIVIDTRGIWN